MAQRPERPAKKAATPRSAPRSARGPLPSRFYPALIGLATIKSEEDQRRRRALGLLQGISATLDRNAAASAAIAGVHSTDLFVLLLLYRVGPDHTARVADLQKSLDFTSGGVTRRLDKMEAAGLAERLPDPDDGRAWLVRLTDQGEAVARQALAGADARNALLQKVFSLKDWDLLIGLLDRFQTVLDCPDTPESPDTSESAAG